MSIYDLQNLSMYKFKQNNSCGIYDTVSKNIIIPAIYEDIKPLTNDYVAAKLGGFYGFVSREGVIISDFIYEEISYFEFGLAIVKREHRYGLIDNSLNLKSPIIYEYMDFLNNGLILIEFKGMYGCLSKKGALVIPPKYKNIGISTKNIIELINGDIIINGYGIARNSANVESITNVNIEVYAENKVILQSCFSKQYFGPELLPLGYISIGEVHIPAFNINQYSNVEVKLTPTWVVIDPGMGKSVPTIPGTLNTIPLQLIKSKTYRIK